MQDAETRRLLEELFDILADIWDTASRLGMADLAHKCEDVTKEIHASLERSD